MGLMKQKAEQEGWFDASGYHPYSGSVIDNEYFEDELDNMTYADYLEWCKLNNSEAIEEPEPVLFQDTIDGPHEFNI